MIETHIGTLQDADENLRAISHEVTKLRAEVLILMRRAELRDRDSVRILARLDRMAGLTEVPGLTRYRQQQAAARVPVERNAPDDLICRLCGEEKEPHDFFFDDGQGNYGYTGRCATCRALPKRQRARIADKRGLTRTARNRAVG